MTELEQALYINQQLQQYIAQQQQIIVQLQQSQSQQYVIRTCLRCRELVHENKRLKRELNDNLQQNKTNPKELGPCGPM